MAQRRLSYFDRINDSILLGASASFNSNRLSKLTDQGAHVQLSSVSPNIGSPFCFPISGYSANQPMSIATAPTAHLHLLRLPNIEIYTLDYSVSSPSVL